jgi:hypothetical protein
MKKYLFSNKDFEIIKLLKSKTPKKIWYNVIQYIIDYGDSYIQLEVKSTTDPSEYEITHTYESTVGFSIINDTFIPSELSIQLCENDKITDIYIVRTLIYHSVYRKPDKKEKNKIFSILTSIRPNNEDKFDTLINQIEGITNDYVVNPNSVIPSNVNPESANIVDVGLLICLDDKYIKAYIQNNDEDFMNYDDQYLFDFIDFTEIKQKYELIKT